MPDAKDIFLRAIECNSADERALLIAEACRGDDALERRVKALLAAHEDPDSYLNFQVLSTRCAS